MRMMHIIVGMTRIIIGPPLRVGASSLSRMMNTPA